MIRSFRYRGLKAQYIGTSSKGVPAVQEVRLRKILAALDASASPAGMDVPGFRLHSLKGPLKGHWAVMATANWRVVFRFEDGDAVDVDYVDYH